MLPVFGDNFRKIRIAGVVKESVVDGPGLRAVVFFQGCPHRCPGCHNPQTWDDEGGYLLSLEEVWSSLAYHPLLAGITLSGGEPLLQPAAARALAGMARARGGNVVLYTGYRWEEITGFATGEIRELLCLVDLLIDGPFLLEEKAELPFRGSRNQRVIDVQASLKTGRVTLWPGPGSGGRR